MNARHPETKGRRRLRTGAALFTGLLWAATAFAQTSVKPGFNFFSASQDVELGRQSAAQIERQIPILRDYEVASYVSRIGARLARVAPGARYPYQFKIANLSDINAFALPGGYIYVHRGLIERVRSEGELAGVMAHEISHVALRHQTNQVSKAYLAKAGVGILAQIFGGESQSGTRIMETVGGVGLNSLFLRFSRKAEEEADVVGAQIMARAGYDPHEMANFFETLRQEAGRDPGKVDVFFSDHPSPVNRAARIRQEATLIHAERRAPPAGDLRYVQSLLRRFPRAPSLSQVLKAQSRYDEQ